ncbi:DnaB-like helicase C-terminal domain-containing protein [Streptomyces europaeiscabiei]|uniref:DnaB-like helicase C-terminal domain-containing protein n=1 Tax=Streptomyces europaeiscabiei TaxID=146819 RepID=UPI0029B57E66|nr:DnaB-like helicase C-terminal domain-containing protein [Streptomyces europaeiscabiei]MDX3694712.1 DnaB-like helicase C-terminal domain-containing protein [Streptomyces europaeiscabiei]
MGRKTNGNLTARARQLAARTGIPYTAALASLRSSRSSGKVSEQREAETGFPGLDMTLGALKPGTLTLLAGQTMAGSTALMLSLARHNAHRGLPVVLAELQSNREQTGLMLLAAESGQDLGPTAEHPADPESLAEAADRLRKLPLYLTAPGPGTLARVRVDAVRRSAGLLLVDDLALAADPGDTPAPPGAAAAALASVARILKIPVVAAAHLGPPCANAPGLGDLRDQHALEHTDHVILLHRPHRLDPVPGGPDPVALHVARPDGTALGSTSVRFEPEYHRMMVAT